MVNLDRITLGAAAGAATNMLFSGIGARLAMRMVVLLTGGQPAITLEGVAGILMIAAVLGAILGVIVALAHDWAGSRWRRADWLLGGLLTLCVGGMFFAVREGEAALLPAWQGLLLFAPLALLSTLATGSVQEWLGRRRTGKLARMAPLAWFGAYCAAFGLAFVGMMSLAGNALRLPRMVWHMASIGSASADFMRTYVPMQLLLAVGSFHVTGPIGRILGRGAVADVLEGCLTGIGVALLAVVYWRLFTRSLDGVRRAPPAISLLVVAGALGTLTMLIGVEPEWGVVRQPLLVTMFSVTLYLLPWLALPLGLLASVQYNSGRQTNAAAYRARVPADAG